MLLEFWNRCKERNPTSLSTWSLDPARWTVMNLPQGLLSGPAVGHTRQGGDSPSHLSLRPRSLAATAPGQLLLRFRSPLRLPDGNLRPPTSHHHCPPPPKKQNKTKQNKTLLAGMGRVGGIGMVEGGGSEGVGR